jgi:hypothetical protein
LQKDLSGGSAGGALVCGTGACPFDVGANPLRLVGELRAMGDTGDARADHIGDAEGPQEPVAIGERRVEDNPISASTTPFARLCVLWRVCQGGRGLCCPVLKELLGCVYVEGAGEQEALSLVAVLVL